MTIEDRVKDIIAAELAVDDVPTSAGLKTDLGADSMDAISLTMALEEAFELEIPDRDAEQLTTVGDVVAYIERRTAAA